jgi:hypothetical protein
MKAKLKQLIVTSRQVDDAKKYLIKGPNLLMRSSLIACLICAMLLINCKNNSSDNSSQNGTDTSIDVDIVSKLTEEKAISLVQQHIYSHPRKITVQASYTEWRSENVPCSQYDIDRGIRCSGEGIGAPYGYKRVQRPYTECCRDKVIQIHAGSGRWNAVNEEKEWKVELSMDDFKKAITWIVDDNSGEVREGSEVSQ